MSFHPVNFGTTQTVTQTTVTTVTVEQKQTQRVPTPIYVPQSTFLGGSINRAVVVQHPQQHMTQSALHHMNDATILHQMPVPTPTRNVVIVRPGRPDQRISQNGFREPLPRRH